MRKHLNFDVRLILPFGIALTLLLLGTIGYSLIEGWKWFESLYMTVITLATVGFSEVEPLSVHGRIFTIFLILCGMVTIAYSVQIFVEYIVQKNIFQNIWRKRMDQKIKALRGHAIICGYGKVGKNTVEQFISQKQDFVLVDKDLPDEIYLKEKGILFINGDATDEEVLKRAGIENASVIVTVVGSDADNLFITISAVGLKPGIRVIARAEDVSTKSKLLRAGAEKVVLPYEIGGRRIAALVKSPSIVEFLDIIMNSESMELEMAEVEVSGGSELLGKNLHEAEIRKRTGSIVMAIKKVAGKFIPNPASDTIMELGDKLVCLGTNEQVESLRRISGAKK